jgi:hypothetical protein
VRIEDLTDRLALGPWAALGAERCTDLRALGRTLSQRIVDAGLLAVGRLRLDD